MAILDLLVLAHSIQNYILIEDKDLDLEDAGFFTSSGQTIWYIQNDNKKILYYKIED